MKLAILIFLMSGISSLAQQKIFHFCPLLNQDKEVIITNAEFSSIIGRKIIFKDLDTGLRKPVDVMEVNTNAILRLKIDCAAAIAEQKKIDSQKKQIVENIEQQRAFLAARERSDRLLAEERSFKMRELDVQETIARAEQMKIEEEQRKREERNKAIEAEKAQKNSGNQ